MDKILKSIGYVGIFGGLGYVLLALAPNDEAKRRIMKEKDVLHTYTNTVDQKKARDFTNVLIAAATSNKTIYGAKQAKEQRLHERAKQED